MFQGHASPVSKGRGSVPTGSTANCVCEGNGCKLQGTFFIYGTMLLPKKVERVPKYDSTVKDTATARTHEYKWHLDPAVEAVRKLVEPPEKKSYGSESECKAACDVVSKKAKKKFGDTLASRKRGRTWDGPDSSPVDRRSAARARSAVNELAEADPGGPAGGSRMDPRSASQGSGHTG
jgi:hypothetical protein